MESFGRITKCEIGRELLRTGINGHGIILTNITSVIMSTFLYTERKGESKLLIGLKDVDFCRVIAEQESSFILKLPRIISIFKDTLAASGNLPRKCPILEHRSLAFNMANLNPKALPYLPEMRFTFIVDVNLNNVKKAVSLNITGQVVDLKKSAIF